MRLDDDTCRSRFAAARHAYLATVGTDAVPHLVPVTFALVTTVSSSTSGATDEVVVAVDHKPKTTRDLRRLRNIAGNPRVALLVDRYDDDWAHLWWVRADGVATVEHDAPGERHTIGEQHAPGERPAAHAAGPRTAALDALAARYPQYRERRPDGPLIRVRVARWSGWAHG